MVVALAHASIPSSERPALITTARLVWAQCFGVPRASPADRLLVRRRPEQPKSHAAFLRRRRAATNQTDSKVGQDPRLIAMAESLWTERHDKEVSRQRKVKEGRARQAAVEGLVADETEDLQAQIADERAAQRRRQQKLDADHKRVANIRNPPVLVDMQGKTVWVDPAVAAVKRESNSQWWAPKVFASCGSPGVGTHFSGIGRGPARRPESSCCSLARVLGHHACLLHGAAKPRAAVESCPNNSPDRVLLRDGQCHSQGHDRRHPRNCQGMDITQCGGTGQPLADLRRSKSVARLPSLRGSAQPQASASHHRP